MILAGGLMLNEILTNMPGVEFFQSIPMVILFHLLISVFYTIYAYFFILDRKVSKDLLLVMMLALIPFGFVPLVIAHIIEYFKRGRNGR